jgi:hypothetical protein
MRMPTTKIITKYESLKFLTVALKILLSQFSEEKKDVYRWGGMLCHDVKMLILGLFF